MDVAAWCGHCGETFRLAEVVDGGAAASCPRCGRAFAASYAVVLVNAVRQLLAGADAVAGAGSQLRQIAPALHVDTGDLTARLTRELGDP